jgi:ATP phosphoribosyltransferase
MIKLALPTGDLRAPVAELLSAVGLLVEGYGEGSRQYRLAMPAQENVRARVFRERDIPVQVALGNYDIGITSLAWVIEKQVRFPQQPLVALADLGLAEGSLFAAVSPEVAHFGALPLVRIATEFPNIGEAVARAARLPRYRVHGVAGAAAAYPPEDADVAIIAARDEAAVRNEGLAPVRYLLENSAWVVANAGSLATKDLSAILGTLTGASRKSANGRLQLPPPVARNGAGNGEAPLRRDRDVVRMAVPDGHQQPHVHAALAEAGLSLEGYAEKSFVRRPASGIGGLEVKVIRPQDMPQLVALGEFDLALTGRDMLNEHLYQFPSSPAYEVIDLQRSQYNLSAVVDGELPADNIEDAVKHWRGLGKPALTVASEFAATADHYARSRHFWRYQVIPIAGASEGFVPEDAEMLIEGTETGRTIAENNLKIIDNIYRSTSCVIANRDRTPTGRAATVYREVLDRLAKAGRAHTV